MAMLGKGKSILSCLQMETYGANVNDCSRHLHEGKQRILMDGYQIPLEFKTSTNHVMNLSGAPANTWLLALCNVCLLLNHLASAALGWKSPEQVLTGQGQIFPSSSIFHFMNLSIITPIPITLHQHQMKNKVGGLALQCMLVMH
jgi:hypothetical protein